MVKRKGVMINDGLSGTKSKKPTGDKKQMRSPRVESRSMDRGSPFKPDVQPGARCRKKTVACQRMIVLLAGDGLLASAKS